MKIDKSLIHVMNKKDVLTVIREAGQIFKAEIARNTGLSIPTVMKITDDLLSRGIIKESGKGLSSGGKPPQLLEFVPEKHYIVGVDIGTTNINCIVMDLSARILHQHLISTQVHETSEKIIARIIGGIEGVIKQCGKEADRILGIGLGMPGLLDPESGLVLFSPDFNWEQVELLPAIKAKFTYPIMMDNVTRVMAMGQRWFGFGSEQIDSFICVNLGHGIGSALFLDGRLYSGGSGSAGELGHMTLMKDGPRCVCGKHGCLEALASGNAIVNRARKAIEAGEATMVGVNKADSYEAKDVFYAAEQGDKLALQIVEEAATYIGTALALVINLLDPQIIILEGGLSRAGDRFIQQITKAAQEQQMRYAGRNCSIVVSKLAENSAAIGAATIILDRFITLGGDREAL